MPAIEFAALHRYTPAASGITLPIILTSGNEAIKLLAAVDTGATHCIFERKNAELLNLDLEAGEPKIFRAATGAVKAFGHSVTLEFLGLKFDSVVYFLADEAIDRNLLGRVGWLDRMRVAIVDHDGELYLAAYD